MRSPPLYSQTSHYGSVTKQSERESDLWFFNTDIVLDNLQCGLHTFLLPVQNQSVWKPPHNPIQAIWFSVSVWTHHQNQQHFELISHKEETAFSFVFALCKWTLNEVPFQLYLRWFYYRSWRRSRTREASPRRRTHVDQRNCRVEGGVSGSGNTTAAPPAPAARTPRGAWTSVSSMLSKFKGSFTESDCYIFPDFKWVVCLFWWHH